MTELERLLVGITHLPARIQIAKAWRALQIPDPHAFEDTSPVARWHQLCHITVMAGLHRLSEQLCVAVIVKEAPEVCTYTYEAHHTGGWATLMDWRDLTPANVARHQPKFDEMVARMLRDAVGLTWNTVKQEADLLTIPPFPGT